MSQTLTARTVELIKPGPKRQEVPDRLLPGLYLIVQPSGARSWAVRYRHHGQARKHTLGPYPALDLKTARDLGMKALRAVAAGADPAREKVQARRAAPPDTVAAVAEQFLEMYCQRVNRPRTVQATRQILDRHVLPYWGRRRI